MNIAIAARADPGLIHRWRRQIGSQQRRRARRAPRPFAALSYLVNGPVIEGLIDLRRLVLVVLHDQLRGEESPVIRVAGYTGTVIPWGVMFGGADQIRLDKNLSLAPAANARGGRLDLAQGGLLSLALQLDRQLERHLDYPHLPRRTRPRLPQLWATVDRAVVDEVCREGLQYRDQSSNDDMPPYKCLAASRRELSGMSLLPLELISHAWQRFGAVFADLRQFPKRQVFSVENPAADLCGYDGAVEFDFFHSRFGTPSSRPSQRRRRRRRAASVVA